MGERRRPTNRDMPKIVKKLMKIPVEPPCDACPWRLYPDKVQGCDNCGCGYMSLYMAVKYYQRAMRYWPYKGQEIEAAKMLLNNIMDLLNQVDKPKEEGHGTA